MAHLPPVGGDHIGCGRQASCATELCHHFTPGETLLRTTRIFCISQRTFQVFTNFNRFVQRPGTVRIERNTRLREALRQCHNRLGLFFPGQYTALQFEIVEAIFFICRFRQAHHRIRRHRFFVTQAIPVTFIIRLALIRQRCGFAITDEEQITEHFDFATLLTIAQQRCHVYPQMLPQQIQHCRFYPGNYMNSGTQIKCLQTAPAGITIGKCITHQRQNVFVFTQRFTHHQRNRIFQRFTDFLAAGNFPYPGVTRIIFDNHNITREERCVCTTQIHQHTVMTRHRDDLHFSNNRRRKLRTHIYVLFQNQ